MTNNCSYHVTGEISCPKLTTREGPEFEAILLFTTQLGGPKAAFRPCKVFLFWVNTLLRMRSWLITMEWCKHPFVGLVTLIRALFHPPIENEFNFVQRDTCATFTIILSLVFES